MFLFGSAGAGGWLRAVDAERARLAAYPALFSQEALEIARKEAEPA